MAIDKKLQIFDDEGNPVDYDILASDVKFLPDGKDLPTKLAEMEQEIEDAGSGDGTVTGVKVGNTPYNPDSNGVVDLSVPFNGKVDKDPNKELIPSTDLAKLQNLPTAAELTQQLNQKANDNTVVKSISVNGQTPQTPTNGNVNIEVSGGSSVEPATSTPQMDGTAAVGSSSKYAREDHVHPHDTTKLSQSDVSVETQGDGTVEINVGSGANKDTYTINLNHTHEGMAKLVVCEESDLPSTLDNSTIYAITDSGETEIEKLIIRGMEFAGGGVPDTGEPMITSPSNGTTINLGTNEGSGVSKTITVRGKNLTGDLTVAVGTGLTISYGQSTGQSSVTIPMAQALLGAQVTIAYSGTGALDDGSLVISHGGSVLSSVVVVVVVVPRPEIITAVKFTGSQWLETDYYPNPNTEFELDMQLLTNSHSNTEGDPPSGPCPYFLSCAHEGNNRFNFLVGTPPAGSKEVACYNNVVGTKMVITYNNADDRLNRSVLNYVKNGSSMSITFNEKTGTTGLKTNTMLSKLAIGYSYYYDMPFNRFDMVIYGFKIKENGVTIKDYRPALYNGVPGLYDYENDDFISSKTSTELVAITN